MNKCMYTTQGDLVCGKQPQTTMVTERFTDKICIDANKARECKLDSDCDPNEACKIVPLNELTSQKFCVKL